VAIEGVGPDSLLFTFAGECRFALDLGADEYRGACARAWSFRSGADARAVLACEPALPEMDALLAAANTTGDVWRFVVQVALAFQSAKRPPAPG
jgi:hypothetical protein